MKLVMYDNVKCKYPLPDCPKEIQEEVWQMKDGVCLLDDYTITKDGKLKKIGDKPLYCFIVEVVDGNDVEMSLAQLSEEELPEYEKKFKISEQHTNTKHLPTLISKNLLD